MKVAKNMDSVFANCTEDELDFDLLFSNDDTIIDFIAGVDEAGIPLTGPDYDYSKIIEAVDMLEDEDNQDERDGKIKHNGTFEGSKDEDLEIGGEVGDGKEVSGREKSAESEAHNMIDLGSETAKQKAIEKAMEIGTQKFIDADLVKENSEYDGYESLIENIVNGFMTEEEIMSENATNIAITTADYLIRECEDQAAREGEIAADNLKYIESIKSKVKDEMTKGKAQGDNFEDPCDCEVRSGKASVNNKDIEGVATRIIGAAMEAASGDIEFDMEDQTIDSEESDMDRYIVPNDIRDNSSSNDIDIKQEIANNLNESVLETAFLIKQAAINENCYYSDFTEYQDIVESVIAELSEDILEIENCAQFVLEIADYIIESVEIYTEVEPGKFLSDDKLEKYQKIKGIKNNIKNKAGAGAALAAKKIADKKKAAKKAEVEVKENYEYEEYDQLIEAVIDGFTTEELMAENASEMAQMIANILIKNAENNTVYDDPDGDDIEDVANQKDNDENPGIEYGYDDDELIDMVIDDDEI